MKHILYLLILAWIVAAPGRADPVDPVIPKSESSIEYETHVFHGNPFGLHIGGIEKQAENIKKTGVKWMRARILWRDVEPSPGMRKWQLSDDMVRRNQDINTVPIFRLEPINSWGLANEVVEKNKAAAKKGTPWREGKHLGYPSEMGAYLAFIQDVVERYDGDGKDDMPGLKNPILLWEVLNEYSCRWISTPEKLGQFFKEVRKAVHQACPEAKLMDGSMDVLAPWAIRDGYLDSSWVNWRNARDRQALIQACKNGNEKDRSRLIDAFLDVAPEVVDYVNFHQYGDWETIPGGVMWLTDQMKARGYLLPIVTTEVGGPFIARGEIYTSQQLADDVVKWHCVCLASGVEIIMWSSMVAGKSWGETFANTSLVDWNTDELKPAYYTYCLLSNKLKDLKTVRRLRLEAWDRQTRVYEFEVPKGKVLVAWSERVSGRMLKLPWPHATAKVTDVHGNIETLSTQKGELTLQLTHSPVFVEQE